MSFLVLVIIIYVWYMLKHTSSNVYSKFYGFVSSVELSFSIIKPSSSYHRHNIIHHIFYSSYVFPNINNIHVQASLRYLSYPSLLSNQWSVYILIIRAPPYLYSPVSYRVNPLLDNPKHKNVEFISS